MSEGIKQKILKYVLRNRVSTTEIADCLGKSGAIEGVAAVNRGHFRAGYIRYIYGHSESNWSIHDQARSVQEGDVVFMDGINVNNRALVGELVTKYLILYREAAAIVALERLRDANDIIKQNYPVWCKGFTPVGCFNRDIEESREVQTIVAERKALYDGALAVCDDTGVVVVPKNLINKEFYQKLELIEQQEDIWFNCIDFKKWSTFDTICLKRYKDE